MCREFRRIIGLLTNGLMVFFKGSKTPDSDVEDTGMILPTIPSDDAFAEDPQVRRVDEDSPRPATEPLND